MLTVPDATTRRDFDYADFEGPQAAAAGKPLTRLSWSTPEHVRSVSVPVVGRTAAQPAFAFEVRHSGAPLDPLPTLLRAIAPPGGALEWTQTAFDDPTRAFTATFVLDDVQAKAVKDTAAFCLQ